MLEELTKHITNNNCGLVKRLADIIVNNKVAIPYIGINGKYIKPFLLSIFLNLIKHHIVSNI